MIYSDLRKRSNDDYDDDEDECLQSNVVKSESQILNHDDVLLIAMH